MIFHSVFDYISVDARVLARRLGEAGVVFTRVEKHEDGGEGNGSPVLGCSIHWTYRGLNHSSGGRTPEEAIAYIAFHIGEAD